MGWLLIILPVSPGCSSVRTHALSALEGPPFISPPVGEGVKGTWSPSPALPTAGRHGCLPACTSILPPLGGRRWEGPLPRKCPPFTVTASGGNALKGFGGMRGVQQMFQSGGFTLVNISFVTRDTQIGTGIRLDLRMEGFLKKNSRNTRIQM